MPDEIPASPGGVAIEARISDSAVIAIKKIIKAVGAAGKPIPAVAAIYAKVFRGLKFELDFRGLDILEYDVIIC